MRFGPVHRRRARAVLALALGTGGDVRLVGRLNSARVRAAVRAELNRAADRHERFWKGQ